MSSADPSQAMPFTVTELEERLRAAGGQQVRAAVAARFTALLEQVEAAMKAGLASPDFSRAQAVRNALSSAQAIIKLFPAGR